MDNNKIGVLNNIIFQIYNIDDFEAMKREVLNSLRYLIPYKCASFLMASGGGSQIDGSYVNSMLADPVCNPEKYTEMENKYLLFEDRDFSSWILHQNESLAFRITDMISDEERKKTEVYKNCFEPYGLHYSLDLTIASRGQLLGDLTLYRGKDESDFSDDEVWCARLLCRHLNSRFYVNKYGHLTVQKVGIGQIGNLIEQFGLTKREAEILYMVMQGRKNDEICEELFVSQNTLKKHLHNLYHKTGVTSRVQLLTLEKDR
ncbi:MAG: helix-turn-helix transcriptional regulator [Bacillota bacterium]|nr:helix-turn-helix transcriptional regulator [Bacillota bacterium]